MVAGGVLFRWGVGAAPRPCVDMVQARTQCRGGTGGVRVCGHGQVLPPLLEILRAVHDLWTPQGRAHVPPHLAQLYAMSPSEQMVVMSVGSCERTRRTHPSTRAIRPSPAS